MTVEIRSFAKINWMLRVLARRNDGYHELETLFQTISLHDVLRFERSTALSVRCSDPTVPVDAKNLVTQAARIMIERFGAPQFAIDIEKQIPAGGGLGGGSSNAAATLLVMRAFSDAEISDDELGRIALGLGSDVPFFLTGGLAYARGRGELLTPLDDLQMIDLLLLFPSERVSTAEAFFDLSTRRSSHDHLEPALNPSAGGNRMLRYAMHIGNDLEVPVFDRLPQLRRLRDRLTAVGATWAEMSGSGSTIVGAFATPEGRDAAASQLEGEGIVAVPARTIGRTEAMEDIQKLGRIR